MTSQIEIEETLHKMHVTLRSIKQGPAYFFYDSEHPEPCTMRLKGVDIGLTREEFHAVRIAMDAFDDRIQKEKE